MLDLQTLGEARFTVEGAEGDPESDLGDSSAAVFVGRSQQLHGRVFGGQVLAQWSSPPAARSRPPAAPHGPPLPPRLLCATRRRQPPIRFAVENVRDGRSFSTRRVHAIQYGKPILSMIASFQEEADGLDHQDPMPAAPDPDSLPSMVEHAANTDDPAHGAVRPGPTHRPASRRGQPLRRARPQRIAQQSVWMRASGQLPDDPLLHAAVLAYASGLLAARADHPAPRPGLVRPSPASGQPRPRDVVPPPGPGRRVGPLHRAVSLGPSGRGLSQGRMFAADGRLVDSVAQEGMMRVKEPTPTAS